MHLERKEGKILFWGGIFFGFNLYPLVPSPETLSYATFLPAPVLWCPMTRIDKIYEILHKALLALMPLSAGEIPAALIPQMLVDSVWQDSFQMT